MEKISKVIGTADWHLGPYPTGRFNPQTGLNTRMEDFLKSARSVLRAAVESPNCAVLDGGDLFKDATPTPTIVREFVKLIKPVLDQGNPFISIVGNHPKGARYGLAHALEPFQLLDHPNLFISDTIQVLKVRNLEVLTVPFYYPHDLSAEQVMRAITAVVRDAGTQTMGTDRILLGHFFTDKSVPQNMPTEKDLVIPVAFLEDLGWGQAIIGHQHKGSLICSDPYMAHPGSIDRVGFNEMDDQKFFIVLDLVKKTPEFVEIQTRPFVEIVLDYKGGDPVLVMKLLKKDLAQAKGAIVKIKVKIDEADLLKFDAVAVRAAAKDVFFLSWDLDVDRQTRTQHIEFESPTPEAMFKQYVKEKWKARDVAALVERGMTLMQEEKSHDSATA